LFDVVGSLFVILPIPAIWNGEGWCQKEKREISELNNKAGEREWVLMCIDSPAAAGVASNRALLRPPLATHFTHTQTHTYKKGQVSWILSLFVCSFFPTSHRHLFSEFDRFLQRNDTANKKEGGGGDTTIKEG
jgi:hypothetical protein